MSHPPFVVKTSGARVFDWTKARALSLFVPAFMVAQAWKRKLKTARYACNMKLIDDPVGRVQRDLAANVKRYALFGGSH
jgi:hypothetical protein